MIRAYKHSLLPVYAIKEFKCGPLRHFMWLHNKFVENNSYSRTIRAIQRAFRKQHQQGTALEAMQVAAEVLVGADLAYANTAKLTDQALADSFRLALRRRIDIAWRDRRNISSEIFEELPCFAEAIHSYNDETRFIDDARRKCDLDTQCCLAKKFNRRPGELDALIVSIEGLQRSEDNRRRDALRLLRNNPKRRFEDKDCKNLGDAYFALQCPSECAILTSNYKDHEILAGALGKAVDKYTP